MRSQNYIGINQRIPLDILEQALIQFLDTGELNRDLVIEQLGIYFTGKNRIVKAYGIIKKIFIDNKHLTKFRQYFRSKDFKALDKGEKNALIIAVISQAYPFSLNLIVNLSSIFKVQEICNTNLIYSKMSSYYGSNRATEIAIYSVIPLLIEMNLIKRIKPGLYSVNQTYNLHNELIIQYFILSYLNSSKTKSILSDEIYNHPWFFFFKPESISSKNNKIKLLNISENKSEKYIFAVN